MAEKAKVTPCVCFSHDDKEGRLSIEVQLPGVDKKDISLEMRRDSFCVSASRGEDTQYSGCFMLAHEVESAKTQARYENGLLKVFAPIKGWEDRSLITVQ
jgi:HSP20 family molecular chaperone IbpA